MKIYRNLNEIRRKEKLGRRLSLIGLGVLLFGLLSSFIPTWWPLDPDTGAANSENAFIYFLQAYWMWLSFLALPLGFIFASFGSYFINRFARRRWAGIKVFARPDEMLERAMKGFDDKYAYFAWSLPAHHVLVGPCGILVMALRSDRGKVTVQGDRWREPFSLLRFFTVFAREGVGNPAFELEDQIKRLNALMAQRPGANGGDTDGDGEAVANVGLPVEPVAIFLNPEMQINLDAPTISVLRADQLKDFVRRKARDARLSATEVREVTEFLASRSKAEMTESKADVPEGKPKAVEAKPKPARK